MKSVGYAGQLFRLFPPENKQAHVKSDVHLANVSVYSRDGDPGIQLAFYSGNRQSSEAARAAFNTTE